MMICCQQITDIKSFIIFAGVFISHFFIRSIYVFVIPLQLTMPSYNVVIHSKKPTHSRVFLVFPKSILLFTFFLSFSASHSSTTQTFYVYLPSLSNLWQFLFVISHLNKASLKNLDEFANASMIYNRNTNEYVSTWFHYHPIS